MVDLWKTLMLRFRLRPRAVRPLELHDLRL